MTEKIYSWSVKLDKNLKQPIREIAFNSGQEIRKIVSDAVRTFLEKAGE
jgi:predicted transcriptional regulator